MEEHPGDDADDGVADDGAAVEVLQPSVLPQSLPFHEPDAPGDAPPMVAEQVICLVERSVTVTEADLHPYICMAVPGGGVQQRRVFPDVTQLRPLLLPGSSIHFFHRRRFFTGTSRPWRNARQALARPVSPGRKGSSAYWSSL